jgi:hypothetical protein
VVKSVRVGVISELSPVPSISMYSKIQYYTFCVCWCYVREYDVCGVTLSVHPHRASWKVCLTTVGIEPETFGIDPGDNYYLSATETLTKWMIPATDEILI